MKNLCFILEEKSQKCIRYLNNFTYSKCPNSIQLVVFCSRAISEYTCGLSLPLSSSLSLILRHATEIHLPKCWLVRLLLTETPISTDAVSSKYKWKSFPTAGSDPGSFQSKSEHASQTAMMNPQTIWEKNLDK
jgi:hypothetical protein